MRAMDKAETIAFEFIDDIAVFRIVGQFSARRRRIDP